EFCLRSTLREQKRNRRSRTHCQSRSRSAIHLHGRVGNTTTGAPYQTSSFLVITVLVPAVATPLLQLLAPHYCLWPHTLRIVDHQSLGGVVGCDDSAISADRCHRCRADGH